jgi:hypothetical protein
MDFFACREEATAAVKVTGIAYDGQYSHCMVVSLEEFALLSNESSALDRHL